MSTIIFIVSSSILIAASVYAVFFGVLMLVEIKKIENKEDYKNE